jgi:uncharacterized cupin superfamily protein
MEHVDVDDIDNWISPADSKRSLSKALATEHLAVNHYELAPGDAFSFGYHRHETQEELFYVIEGEATFDTEDGTVSVGAGEAVRFAPGEWQHGYNGGDDRVVALALGAPADAGETEIIRRCPDCEARRQVHIESVNDREALVAVCEACGAETVRYS